MKPLEVLDLFAGIGGFSLGLERTRGFRTVAFCEIEEFQRRVLALRFPDVPIYRDVKNVNRTRLAADGLAPNIVTGGFPCQDISLAGKQEGLEGERSGLWSEMWRILGDVRPDYAIVENVANLLSGPSEQPGAWFGQILADLAAIGYHAEWHCIPASYIGAPHRRDRVWIVAYPARERSAEAGQFRPEQPAQWFSGCGEAPLFADYLQERIQRRESQPLSRVDAFSWCQDVRRAEDLRERPDLPPPLFRGSIDGIPDWVDRLGSCGNAVVPQIPELIGDYILMREGRR